MSATGTPLLILSEVLGSRDSAIRTLAALERAGFVCVPRVATEKMLEDAYWPIFGENGAQAWDEMIKSAMQAQESLDQ